jgi:hypothetical protein
MRTVRLLLLWNGILLVAAGMVACSSISNHVPNVQLQSVTISPATANSQAQFTATGVYSDGSKVTPLPALWFPFKLWYVPPMNPVNWGSVDETGKASCGVTGSFSVFATAPVDPHFPLSQMTPTTPQVFGTAQLSCP